MAEPDLKGRPPREIDAKVHELLREPADVARAWLAFNAFVQWREQLNVQSMAHEVTLVSEAYQYGGTPDCIAYVGGRVGLLDFKTCNKVPKEPYAEQLMVMAAHAALWNEAYPQRPVAECHIIYLPKDGGAPAHHAYADLAPKFAEFRHLLAAFAATNGTPRPADARDAEIARLKAEVAAAAAKSKRPRTVRPTPKERLKGPLTTPLPFVPPLAALPKPEPTTMAELLRAYGHVRS
jgi:hypothetical protein